MFKGNPEMTHEIKHRENVVIKKVKHYKSQKRIQNQ